MFPLLQHHAFLCTDRLPRTSTPRLLLDSFVPLLEEEASFSANLLHLWSPSPRSSSLHSCASVRGAQRKT